jgi:hypothetical protein
LSKTVILVMSAVGFVGRVMITPGKWTLAGPDRDGWKIAIGPGVVEVMTAAFGCAERTIRRSPAVNNDAVDRATATVADQQSHARWKTSCVNPCGVS